MNKKMCLFVTLFCMLLLGVGFAKADLIAYYNFDFSTDPNDLGHDSSGNGHHGAAIGNVKYGSGPAGFGNAFLSDDATQRNYIRVPNAGNESMNIGGPHQNVTMAAWMNIDNSCCSTSEIVTIVALGEYGYRMHRWKGGGMEIDWSNMSPNWHDESSGNFAPGQAASDITRTDPGWHHIVLQYDSAGGDGPGMGRFMTYLDGQLHSWKDTDGSSPDRSVPEVPDPATHEPAGNIKPDLTGEYVDLGIAVKIDNLLSDQHPYYLGGIDEVAIWDDVLTADEIAELYTDGVHVCTARPAADLNGDCVVDIDDLAIEARDWLSGS